MIEVIYTSAATKKMTDSELDELLEKARVYNQLHQITGALLYHNGSFIQALEGPEKEVEALVELIKKDNRHQKINTFWRRSIKNRSFPDWSMGFVNTTGVTEKPEGYMDYDQLIYEASTDGSLAHNILFGFKEGRWRV